MRSETKTRPGTENRNERADSAAVDVARLTAAEAAERIALLGSSDAGLSRPEAARRLRVYGLNQPVRAEARHVLAGFLSNFTHTLALLLWFAAALAVAAGIPQLALAIVAVIAINGLFAFVQEYRASRVIESLMRSVAVRAKVLRDGTERKLLSVEVVPGDVVRLIAGDVVPADSLVLTSDHLTLDLSMVTGESTPVERTAAAVNSNGVRSTDVTCIVPSGASVVAGSGVAVAYATGEDSTLGQVAALVAQTGQESSVLERQVAELSRITATIAVLAGGATLMVAELSSSVDILTALTFATGVIVALVPEGLLPTLSVALAVGARRMAERGAAIRRLSAVEAIGAVTTICTDKTGTLTQNSLSVLGFEGAGETGGTPAMAFLAAALCNDARASADGFAGDPIDVALATWVGSQYGDAEALRQQHPRLADVAFSAGRRFMSVTCAVDGKKTEFVKGAPEAVLTRCAPHVGVEDIDRAIRMATARGERVILIASGEPGAALTPIGVLRLHDPPRPEVPAAIAACRRASVRVIMLTGDHPETARAVAETIGLSGAERSVVDGGSIDSMSDSVLLVHLHRESIFARIDPGQKLRITTLLRRNGEVVVVTGDGINDAPALRAADVGVAMGLRGTEVAKQSADIVLADDNFATIVAAIEEGRSITANIRRFVSYVFTHDVAELMPFLVYVFFAVPLPLAVAQVLAIDLGTDLLPALALGAEPPSGETMLKPPEPPRRPLLTRSLALKTFLLFGVLEGVLGLAAFFAYHAAQGWRPFDAVPDSAAARTLTFIGIISGQVGCLFAQRDGGLRARLSLRTNRWLVWGLGVELTLMLALIYVPGVNGLFSMTSIEPQWLLVVPAGAAVFIAFDVGRRACSRAVNRLQRARP